MRHLLLALALLLASGGNSFANGKFYRTDKVPLDVPYQRALILYDKGVETLLLQSKYSGKPSEAASGAIGWVVPVPSVPELASMKAEDSTMLFWTLERFSSPKIIFLAPIVFLFLLLASASTYITIVVTKLGKKPVYRKIASFSAILFFILVGFVTLFSSAGARKSASVNIIKAEQVGIYDVKVVKADSANALVDWLNENKFSFEKKDEDTFNKYVKDGWCFVVAKIDFSREGATMITPDGLAAPLIMRFKSAEAIYPLALTALSGSDTEIMLYVFAEKKANAGGRLKMACAGISIVSLNLADKVIPKGFYGIENWSGLFCTKFRGRLTPEQMKDDLKITFTDDAAPYRETVVVW